MSNTTSLRAINLYIVKSVGLSSLFATVNEVMMRIVIAGTNGLAQFIAYYLSQLTCHSFVLLTRTVRIFIITKADVLANTT